MAELSSLPPQEQWRRARRTWSCAQRVFGGGAALTAGAAVCAWRVDGGSCPVRGGVGPLAWVREGVRGWGAVRS
jgi:hypothetical protein